MLSNSAQEERGAAARLELRLTSVVAEARGALRVPILADGANSLSGEGDNRHNPDTNSKKFHESTSVICRQAPDIAIQSQTPGRVAVHSGVTGLVAAGQPATPASHSSRNTATPSSVLLGITDSTTASASGRAFATAIGWPTTSNAGRSL